MSSLSWTSSKASRQLERLKTPLGTVFPSGGGQICRSIWMCLSEHLLHGTMGTRGLTRNTNSLVHKNAVSLSALFLLTFHRRRHLYSCEARLLTSGLFSSLMKLLPKDCRITVRLNPREQDPHVAEVVVVAGVVQPCSALQVILPPWLKTTWPCVPVWREQLLKALLHVAEVNAMLVVHVLNAVSFTMELSLSEKHSSTQEILQRLQSCKSYILDLYMKALASSLGKNVYDTTRWCKELKLRMATNACREQRRERGRYVRTTREVVARGSHVGDRSRCDSIFLAVTGNALQSFLWTHSCGHGWSLWHSLSELLVFKLTFSDVVPVLLRTSVSHFSEDRSSALLRTCWSFKNTVFFDSVDFSEALSVHFSEALFCF